MKYANDFRLTFCVVVLLVGIFFHLARSGAAEGADDPDLLPMFGQPKISRPEKLQKADEAFIRDNTLRYKSRQAASMAYAGRGWSAIRIKQLSSAMLLFNQAWLLNPKNYQAFWGFGAVLSQQGRLSEAIDQLETARELIDEPAQRAALLSDLGTVHSEYAARVPSTQQLERAQRFVVANTRFTECLETDPGFAAGWREWAISLYEQERYSEAWARVKRARELRAEPFPPEFLQKLSAKMPEPK